MAANGDKQESDGQVGPLGFHKVMQTMSFKAKPKHLSILLGLLSNWLLLYSRLHMHLHITWCITYSCHVSLLACQAYIEA